MADNTTPASVTPEEASVAPEEERPVRRVFFYRHSLVVRITHWVNVLCIAILLMSGLQIFNAHPALYIGDKSNFDHPVLAMGAMRDANGAPYGVTQILGKQFNTTGVLGLSNSSGRLAARGFPSWITLPSYQDLATGRRWHFFFAWLFVINGLVYALYTIASGHWRQLVPTGGQLRHIGASIREHLLLRFPKGEESKSYNVLQKLAYFGVVAVLLPVMILAGLTMSPGVDSAFPWLLEVFGGRQTARTIHFVLATLIVLFVLVHVVMVLLSGVWNNLRSMITGKYRIEEAEEPHAAE
jgi:thiosulfate reductase cytochrome b subunit